MYYVFQKKKTKKIWEDSMLSSNWDKLHLSFFTRKKDGIGNGENKKTGGILSRNFALFMQITAIIILLGTCAIFVLASRGKIEIDKTHINSAVFCALGLSFLCFVPSKFIVYKESCLFNEDEKNKNSAFSAFVLNLSAGLILVLLSIWKFFH